MGRYRWKTWARGNLPSPLSELFLFRKPIADCGDHEWYRATEDLNACYHCALGVRQTSPYHHFYCPRCERVTTKPWAAVWCLGNGDFSNYGPSTDDARWCKMEQVGLTVWWGREGGGNFTTGSTGVCEE